jgi:hypothetical protein
MYIRRTFNTFLQLQSDATPAVGRHDWVIDWRWVTAPQDDSASQSERSLIDCPAWARPKTPRHG